MNDYCVVEVPFYGSYACCNRHNRELFEVFESTRTGRRCDKLIRDVWKAVGKLRIAVFNILIDFSLPVQIQQKRVIELLSPYHGDNVGMVGVIKGDIMRMTYYVGKLSKEEIPEEVAEATNNIFNYCAKDGSKIPYCIANFHKRSNKGGTVAPSGPSKKKAKRYGSDSSGQGTF